MKWRPLPFVPGLMVAGLLAGAACGSSGPASPTRPESPSATPPAEAATAAPVSTPASTGEPATPRPLAGLEVEEAFPNLAFSEMVYMAYPDDGSGRLFVVLRQGKIMVFPNDSDVASAGVVLDISERVSTSGSEEGLLGLAFEPDYAGTGRFYVYYSASRPRRSVLSRFTVSAGNTNEADRDSEQVVLEVGQPYANHNGGQILFGPDGYLYIGLGDGGSGGDPHGNGQNLATLLGAILRIDVRGQAGQGAYAIPADNPFGVRGDGARGEIWAYGLRNPWRFSFDRSTGTLWAADVGQNRFEEVDVIEAGRNYGWNITEGTHCFTTPDGDCGRAGLTLPVTEYDHSDGCSVTGGYVYRGSRLPTLYGAYVYGDFCSGKIWAIRYDGSTVTEQLELADTSIAVSSFAEDQAGEVYILDFQPSSGKIYRFASP